MVLQEADIDRACKAEEPPVEPDVYVDVESGAGNWVRIPVTSVEEWINKDGPASVTRSAKVRFPAEWDGSDITTYIDGFRGDQQQYDEARIWYRDKLTDEYILSHYGYVGGVGPSTDAGVMKMWVYDPADLLRRIPVSKGFRNASLEDILNFVVSGQDDTGEYVGLNFSTTFDTVDIKVLGTQESSDVGGLSIGPFELSLAEDFPPQDGEFSIPEPSSESSFIGQKTFEKNKDNMVSVMNWLSENMAGKWWFEPAPSGPILTVDFRENATAGRRLFEDLNVTDTLPTELEPFSGDVRGVETIHNEALEDIKPLNFVEIFGETSSNRDEQASVATTSGITGVFAELFQETTEYAEAASSSGYTEEYPYAKAVYDPLLDRAGGYEYGPPPVNSDAVYLKQAENQAISELKKHLQESTEGSIEVYGQPYIMPNDIIRTIPVCEETYPNVTAEPIAYEVNEVRHKRSAGNRYTTELGVSFTFLESEVTITSEYRDA